MFGLGWCMAVEVWIGVGNINFPYENGLLWVQLGSQPTCRANLSSPKSRIIGSPEDQDLSHSSRISIFENG